jgi:hypothetical protein
MERTINVESARCRPAAARDQNKEGKEAKRQPSANCCREETYGDRKEDVEHELEDLHELVAI